MRQVQGAVAHRRPLCLLSGARSLAGLITLMLLGLACAPAESRVDGGSSGAADAGAAASDSGLDGGTASGGDGGSAPGDAGPGFDGGTLGGEADGGGEPRNEAALEAMLTRSSEAKLQEALDRGELTTGLAALYHVYARHAPHLLPAAYATEATDAPAPTFAWSKVALASRASYTPEQQANLDAIFARPGTPQFRNFNVAPPADTPRCIATLAPNSERLLVMETQHFSYFVLASTAAAAGGDLAATIAPIAARLTTALEAPIANEGAVSGSFSLKNYFEAVYAYYVASGFTPPTSLPEVQANGGKVPVYAFGCGTLGEDAGAEPIGNMYVSIKLAFEDPALKKVVLPHELAHLFTADAPTAGAHVSWPFEAMATALEHLVSKEVRRWSAVKAPGTTLGGYFTGMNRSFACPEEPFHSSLRGRCRTAIGDTTFPGRLQGRYQGDYSKFVFFLWYYRQHGSVPRALSSWWQQYVGAGGIPHTLVSAAELSDFQLALLGDVAGQPKAFDPEDRARFDAPAADLDFAPPLRQRYTFRFEDELFVPNNYRLAGVASSSQEPKVPDTRPFPLKPGATARILVEIPALPLMPAFPGLPTVTWQDEGPTPVRKVHYVGGSAGFPNRSFIPWDAAEAEIDASTFGISPTATRNLLVVLTSPPSPGGGDLRTRWGVSLGSQCAELCALRYQDQRLGCCGTVCARAPYEGCTADCRDAHADPRAESDFCIEYCTGTGENYSQLFSGDPYASAAAKICGAGEVAPTTPSGLVPISTWISASCDELIAW